MIAVLAALAWGWSLLVGPELKASLGDKKLWLESLCMGVLVAVVWVLLLGATPEADATFSAGLAELSPVWAVVWLVFRYLGAIVTVPIAEELAFRGYLLCQLSRSEAYITGKLPFVWLAAVISAVAFGALHGAWIAGAVAVVPMF
ncbi:MAG: CPBP family glutamic-type intramembrane protease [Marinagarivorans sp.]|nr:CPBP family glutamic-type intramembrane protease [Marinagarivorans sp.]